jgi:molybdopterin converting factor small subunit
MMVRVRLFAVAREIAGADIVEVEITEGATAGDVARMLAKKLPALEQVIGHSIMALDGEPAGADTRVPENAEVALIPPVSGG